MTRVIGSELPRGLYALVDGQRIDELGGFTALLLTTDADSWVSVALLSVGEVLGTAPTAIRLALWPGTKATLDLAERRTATMAMVHDGSAYYVRVIFRRGRDLRVEGKTRAFSMAGSWRFGRIGSPTRT